MYCIHCGKEIDDSSLFCPYCGGHLGRDMAPAQGGPQQPAQPQQTAEPQPEQMARYDQPQPEQPEPAERSQQPGQSQSAQPGHTDKPQPEQPEQQPGHTERPEQPEQQPDHIEHPQQSEQQTPLPRQPEHHEQPTPTPPVDPAPAPAQRRKSPAGPIALALIIAAALVVAVILIMNHRQTVNLADYLEITFTGYDGYGTATYTLDTEDETLAGLGLDWYACELTPAEGLHNDDTVTFSWNIDEDDLAAAEEAAGCRIAAEDVTVTVEDLEEITTFDAFDGATLTFTGAEPEGTAELTSVGSDPVCQELDYHIDPSTGLSNGDTVTITIGDPDRTEWVTALIEQYGKAPAATTQTYTVEGLGYYATSASEIPEDTLQKMQMRAKETFLARDLDRAGDAGIQTMTGYEYIGTYLLSAREQNANVHNKVYLVYKYRMHLLAANKRSRYEEDIDAYWACEFDNVLVLPDGSCEVDLESYHAMNGEEISIDSGVAKDWASNRAFRFDGYQDLDTMYADLVTAQADQYTSENNVEDVELEIAEEAEDSDVLLPYEADAIDDVSDSYDEYETAMRYRSGNGGLLAYTEYWLKGQYDTLTFTVQPTDSGTWWGGDHLTDLYISNAETGEILESITVGDKDIPREYTVDISGVDALAISNQRRGYLAYLLVADATVTSASGKSATLQYAGNIPAALPESADHGDAVSLAAMSTYADTNYGKPDPTTVWATDALYIWSNTISLDPGAGGNESKAVYDLDGLYTTLTFEYAPASGDSYDKNADVTLRVLNEETDEVLYTADIDKSTAITDVTLDVTDVRYLAFEVNRRSDHLYNKVLINNAYLSVDAD